MNWRAATTAIAALMVACDDSEFPADGGSDASPDVAAIALEAWPEAVATAACSTFYACCTDDEIGASLGPLTPRDETDCLSTLATIVGLSIDSIRTSEEAGRLTYDDVKAAECLISMSSASCAELGGSPLDANGPRAPTCNEIFVPRAGPGQSCSSDLECTTGACRVGSGGAGTCVGLPAEGDSCLASCGSQLFCKDGFCTPVLINGEGCETHIECSGGACVAGRCSQTTVCTGR